MAQFETVVPQQFGALRGVEGRRHLRRLREGASARDNAAVGVAIGNGAESLLHEAVDHRLDVRDVRAVVAAGADRAQVAHDRGTRCRDQRAALAKQNQVLERLRAPRERQLKVIAHQALDPLLHDRERPDARSKDRRDQHQCRDQRNPVVLADKRPACRTDVTARWRGSTARRRCGSPFRRTNSLGRAGAPRGDSRRRPRRRAGR